MKENYSAKIVALFCGIGGLTHGLSFIFGDAQRHLLMYKGSNHMRHEFDRGCDVDQPRNLAKSVAVE
jgi:hypothetical protein